MGPIETVIVPVLVIGVFLVVILAWRGRLDLDPPGVRTLVRFVGVDGDAALRALGGGEPARDERGRWTVTRGGFLVECGRVEGDEDEEWLLSVHARKDTPELRALLAKIDETLRRLDGVSGIEWHRRQDWNAGKYDSSTETPFQT